MQPNQCCIVCFSPTGGTRKLAEAVAAGLGLPTAVSDVTLPEARLALPQILPRDVVLLAAPVYYGRVAALAAQQFSRLTGGGQPAILLLSYGNRHYDDALLELRDTAAASGFVPVGAGAFIAEHSFSTVEFPMAAGRPDAGDFRVAEDFGRNVGQRLTSGARPLGTLPGTFPYKAYPDMRRAPLSTADCTCCGTCVGSCPTGAISLVEGRLLTDERQCIICQACVKLCPENARVDGAPGGREGRERLAPLTAARRDPETFL